MDVRHLIHETPGGGEGEGGGRGGDAAGMSDLVGGALALLRSAHAPGLIVLPDPSFGTDLPDRIDRGHGRRQLLQTAEDGQCFLGRPRGGARQRVPHRCRRREGLQHDGQDLGERDPRLGAPVERSEPVGDRGQRVLTARRGGTGDRLLLIGAIPAAFRIHASQRTCVRKQAKGLRRNLWITPTMWMRWWKRWVCGGRPIGMRRGEIQPSHEARGRTEMPSFLCMREPVRKVPAGFPRALARPLVGSFETVHVKRSMRTVESRRWGKKGRR